MCGSSKICEATCVQVMKMVEINFLCVHKKLRSKRLAPVLIKEITRRVNRCNIWQAAFTAGALLPRPFATCRYWHRSLNPKKLTDVGFSRLAVSIPGAFYPPLKSSSFPRGSQSWASHAWQ